MITTELEVYDRVHSDLYFVTNITATSIIQLYTICIFKNNLYYYSSWRKWSSDLKLKQLCWLNNLYANFMTPKIESFCYRWWMEILWRKVFFSYVVISHNFPNNSTFIISSVQRDHYVSTNERIINLIE